MLDISANRYYSPYSERISGHSVWCQDIAAVVEAGEGLPMWDQIYSRYAEHDSLFNAVPQSRIAAGTPGAVSEGGEVENGLLG